MTPKQRSMAASEILASPVFNEAMLTLDASFAEEMRRALLKIVKEGPTEPTREVIGNRRTYMEAKAAQLAEDAEDARRLVSKKELTPLSDKAAHELPVDGESQ